MTENKKQEFLIAFGNRIRRIRTDKQLSLDELARKCGYTSENARSSMQKIEAGKSDVPASKIQLLAQALETPISELMGWEEAETKTTNECELLNLTKLYLQLDTLDKGRVLGYAEQMLKSDKYTIKKELSTENAV